MQKITLILFWCLSHVLLFGQQATLFDENTVGRIEIFVRPDSFEYIYTNLINDEYIRGDFFFTYQNQVDSFKNIGLRMRGNTSLSAQKKSFKVSFNEFDEDGEFQGLRKLNLRGSHNDPSMMRERLFYKAWNDAGMPERRSAFVDLYINGVYYGLYTNIEEIDKRWLDRVYGDNDGNLYKCQWPASLAYLGTSPGPYKALMHSDTERAYDLKTNELADDYTRFAQLATTLNEPVDASYPAKISAILNVESVLKSFAFDVATGNWDDYFYNQNNYYLYDNPATGKFEFVVIDTDNTFGVDWVNRDWATRNCLDWYSHSSPRPLATKLMAVPAYKQQFMDYLFYLTNNIVSPNHLFPWIDDMHELITPSAAIDTYRTYDYDYSMNDFHNSLTQTIDGHTPYGIKPFIENRRNNTLQQLAGLVSTETAPEPSGGMDIWPNPAHDIIQISNPQHRIGEVRVYDALGEWQRTLHLSTTADVHWIEVGNWPVGMYILRSEVGVQRFFLVRNGE